MNNMFDLTGKVALVTGGAHSIGFSLGLGLAKAGAPAIEGTVEVSEMMGSSVHLHVTALGVDTIIIVQTMGLDQDTLNNFAIGKALAFDFDGTVAHVFDKNTGNNLEF